MKVAVVVLVLVAVCAAAPEKAASSRAMYAMAVDVTSPTSTQMFNCFRNYNYQTAFVRIYSPGNNGHVDPNGPTNVLNANNAGMGIEVFVTPSTTGVKQGYQQLDEAYNYMVNQGITVRSIWLQVTSPINWGSNQYNNHNFIYSFIQRASQKGLSVGIYTNSYDWQQITGDWQGWSSIGQVSLWYWHVTGSGQNGQTSPNFNDFTSFAGFTQPAVKQFGQEIYVCSNYVNVNVYRTSMNKRFLAAKQKNKLGTEKLIVGELFMNQ